MTMTVGLADRFNSHDIASRHMAKLSVRPVLEIGIPPYQALPCKVVVAVP